MATQTRKRSGGTRFVPSTNAPGNASRYGRAPKTPRRRFRQRLIFILHHPVDAAWGWLSSVRTAILLIASITVICLLGIYFVQAPGEVLGDAATYAAWVQQNALPRYGSLTPIFDWLHFFTIFSSWYFMLLLTILSLSIIVCTLNRAPAIWQNFKHPVIRRSEKFYQHALERASFTHPDPLAFATTELRKRHYRIRTLTVQGTGGASPRPGLAEAGSRPGSSRGVSENNDTGGSTEQTTYLYANKNSWATLATFVFHAALVTLLMAGVISQWHGLPPDSPARRILPAPLVSLSDSLAGFTFDQALPTGQSAVVYPRGTPHNISFRVNNFTATFDPKTGLATDYVTNLSVYRDGQLVARSNHLRVNDPLSYDGIIFHQSSLIPSVTITISDSQGCLVCAQAIVLDQTSTAQGLQFDIARDIPIAGTSMTLSVFFPHSPSLQLAQIKHPLFLTTIGIPGKTPDQDNVAQLSVGQSQRVFNKQWTITVNNAQEATVLLVTKDSGSLLIWPTAVILILSLCLTFYFPQRRIWIRVRGTQVNMAALHEHFTNIRTDLLALSRNSTH